MVATMLARISDPNLQTSLLLTRAELGSAPDLLMIQVASTASFVMLDGGVSNHTVQYVR